MFPKTGTKLHPGHLDQAAFARTVAQSLQQELGQSHRATKTLMRWTGASSRTAKNWLAGNCGPCGHHLVDLCRASDPMLATFLAMAGREQVRLLADLAALRDPLRAAVEAIEAFSRK